MTETMHTRTYTCTHALSHSLILSLSLSLLHVSGPTYSAFIYKSPSVVGSLNCSLFELITASISLSRLERAENHLKYRPVFLL